MKKILLIAVGLMLSVVIGCVAVQPKSQNQTGSGTTIFEKLQLIKAEGCDAIPELERKLLLLLVQSRIEGYPSNGLCNPRLIDEIILKQIAKLEESRPQKND